jgi:hypothetical protein
MDINCVVCGEPWDAYGVRHGDMLGWEAELFRAGAGCPSCEGKPNGWVPQTYQDVENGDEDPMERINARENHESGTVPKWERPADEVLWQCDACGVTVIRDSDDGELEYRMPRDARGRKWYQSHPWYSGTPDDEPAHVFSHGAKVCEFCHRSCDGCGRTVSHILEVGDTYDDGWCTTLEPYGYSDVFCIDCVEESCSECNCLAKDCDCSDE